METKVETAEDTIQEVLSVAEDTRRGYLDSHPWIKFRADLKEAPYTLWLLLGEARSKLEHIAGVPLRPETAEQLHRLYIARGALATTAIEGNTLSEQQVLDHLDGKLDLPASQRYLAKEIDNIVAACNHVRDEVLFKHNTELTPETIGAFNSLVLDGLELDDGVTAGAYRHHAVQVARYRGAPAEDCPYLVERLCDWLNGGFAPPREDLKMALALIKAVLAHLYLAWIHPFGDGNGRTARLIEVQILISAGVPTPAAHLLSNHYNQTRTDYYRCLDRASKSGGDIIPFLIYAVRGFVDGLKRQLSEIREMQWDVAWENYVHEAFKSNKGPTAERRRWLVLDLSGARRSVSKADIRGLTPRLAGAYANFTEKTLSRDLNAVVEMKLVTVSSEGYHANRDLILAFLPPKAQGS